MNIATKDTSETLKNNNNNNNNSCEEHKKCKTFAQNDSSKKGMEGRERRNYLRHSATTLIQNVIRCILLAIKCVWLCLFYWPFSFGYCSAT